MLHVHRAERADRLIAGLVDVVAEPLRLATGEQDPFAAEVIAVPAKGVERWVTQRLSDGPGGGAGVCANVRFLSPRALVQEVTAAVVSEQTSDDAWTSGRMLFGLLGLGPVGRWRLPVDRLVAAAGDLANLFAAYAAQRPALLGTWAAGEDADADGEPLPEDLRWQPSVWRRLRERLGVPSPAELVEMVCATLRERPDVVDLPSRLSVFGPTRLTRDQLSVLAALAEHRDVHLWLPHPSPAMWDAVAPLAASAASSRRRDDRTAELPRHPLLASLGRDSRELQLLLASAAAEVVDHHHELPDRPGTLLGRLQADLAADQPSPPEERDDKDLSLQVHACHGPARQVEVLREVLLGLLDADPSLEPRDVLVMCPDIEAYAPLIAATFGLADPELETVVQHPGHRLRVRLADRSLRQTNPLLSTLAQLLDLAGSRVTASQVLDLAASAPVRRRFGFDDEQLELLRDWVARTGVRWGLDARHRQPFRLDSLPQNTWETGLDRLLLGAAMSEDSSVADGVGGSSVRWLGTALPLDDIESNDIDLAGRLAELVDRLADVLARLEVRQPLGAWLTTLTHALDLLCATSEQDAWQQAQARRELADVADGAAGLRDTLELGLDDVRALLAGRLQGRPTRANFRTGSLTMCSMVPMRSVPHRVICLLGLDDGAYPRNVVVNGDDLLARDPIVGERDARSEDRQLLLDAVLAAEEHLVVLYTGADERTNARRPPSVPVGEILDAVDRLLLPVGGVVGRGQVTTRHPLQPFDPRNFAGGLVGASGPFSFDRPALEGARAAVGEREPVPPFLAGPLDAAATNAVELERLIQFLEHPVRGFLRQRLDVTLARDEEHVADDLTVELDNLTRWAIGDRLLSDLLRGADLAAVRQAEWRRGVLPPSVIGQRVLDEVLREVTPLLTASADLRAADGRTVDVAVDLADGRRLGGTVAGVHGTTVVRVTYSRLGAKHRLRAWAQVLALTVAQPSEMWRAVVVAKAGRGGGAQVATLGPVAPELASQLLDELVDLYGRGLRSPLPLAAKTSFRYAEARSRNRSVAVALRDAGRDWVSSYGGEQTDREHELIWGEGVALDALLDEPPAADEAAWFGETSRFGALARRLWTPLLAHEVWSDS